VALATGLKFPRQEPVLHCIACIQPLFSLATFGSQTPAAVERLKRTCKKVPNLPKTAGPTGGFFLSLFLSREKSP
jgi:hypothetical protein